MNNKEQFYVIYKIYIFLNMPKTMIHDINDLTEPNTDNDNSFSLNLKQINFIRNDNKIEFMNNIMKIMKTYKLEVDDFKNIFEDYQNDEI